MFPRFIRVLNTSFLFRAEQRSIVCISHSSFICSFVGGYVGCFYRSAMWVVPLRTCSSGDLQEAHGVRSPGCLSPHRLPSPTTTDWAAYDTHVFLTVLEVPARLVSFRSLLPGFVRSRHLTECTHAASLCSERALFLSPFLKDHTPFDIQIGPHPMTSSNINYFSKYFDSEHSHIEG